MKKSHSYARVLVVDDEPGFRSLLRWRLEERHLEVHTANDGQEAIAFLRTRTVDLVIVDLTMPHLQGLDVLKTVKRLWPRIEVIILTGFCPVDTAVHALKAGAFDLLLKPFNLPDLFHSIDGALKKSVAP
jgi:DNA-binding NtrC family response regulator